MSIVLKYRGRVIDNKDVDDIRQLISSKPGLSRWALSKELCQAWNWTQANGSLKDMVCRSLMLQLHREGHIELPPIRCTVINSPQMLRKKPRKAQSLEEHPVTCPLSELQPLKILQVRRSKEESLFNSLIETHHYLGYTQPVGEHLKYMVCSGDRPIACFAWSSAVRHLKSRDDFIGWSPLLRQKNLHLIAYNTRYLILPWVRVPHLASHLLGIISRRINHDWQSLYAHPVYFLETFIDPGLYRGTCYRAANWVSMGMTTGRGKNDHTNQPNRSLKEVLGYPLRKDFRQLLCA